MKVSVFRAVADPAQLFWAPMIPAGLNMVFAAIGGILYVQAVGGNPLTVFILMVFGHAGIVAWGQKEPHLTSLLEPYMMSKRKTTNFFPSKGNKFVP